MVLFSAKSRVVGDLSALAAVLGEDRALTVARELTKAHEEVWSGTLGEAAGEWTSRDPRGEFTLVIAGRAPETLGMNEAISDVIVRMTSGEAMSDAVKNGRREFRNSAPRSLRSRAPQAAMIVKHRAAQAAATARVDAESRP